MLFAFIGKDKPGILQVRLDNRPAHVAYLEKLNAEGTLKIAGPFLGVGEELRDRDRPVGLEGFRHGLRARRLDAIYGQ